MTNTLSTFTKFLSCTYLLSCIAAPVSSCFAESQRTEILIRGANPYGSGESQEMHAVIQSADPASSLKKNPGVHLATGGGISALPVIRGLNDDRINTIVNGAKVTSACANHMNPSLSYVDPFFGSRLEVRQKFASIGDFGDSIGDTIVLQSVLPEFSLSKTTARFEGKIGTAYRSNGDGLSELLHIEWADSDTFASYTGSYNKSNSYNDGRGRKVYSTQFEAITNSLNISKKFEDHLSTLNISSQNIPYQGFVNQYMDMTDNLSTTISALDKATFDWGRLDSSIFFQNTDHEMGFFSREKIGQMPMETKGTDYGYSAKAEIPVKGKNLFRLGTDLHRFDLDDKWPAIPGSMMMGPNDYLNINNGHKTVIGNFVEVELAPTEKWTTRAGIRYNLVKMDTGDVRSYSDSNPSGGMGMMDMKMDMGMEDPDLEAATVFNSRDRSKVDHNIELNFQAKYEPDLEKSLEFGYSRKVRSPNLYERYAWGRGTMAMTMIGWYGDANGYVGDIDLNPEVAHTLSTTLSFHNSDPNVWRFSASPYISYVEDFIDADVIGTFNPRMNSGESRRLLQFSNHDARLYGLDFEGSVRLIQSSSLGDVSLNAVLSVVRGSRVDTGSSLYRMMPFNARVGVAHKLRGWDSSVELEMAAGKSKVDPIRDEPETPGFAIANLQTGYEWKKMRFQVGVNNIFDTYYELPLGGVDYSDFGAGQRSSLGSVPGAGRSINVGLLYRF